MKHLIFLFSVLLTSSSLFATSLINVQVLNPTESQFKISYEKDPISGKERIFKIKLRDNHTAAFELSLPDAIELTMQYGDLKIPLFVGPEDQLSIVIDASKGMDGISFSGDSSKENDFIVRYASRFPSTSTTEIGGGFLPFKVNRSILAEASSGDASSFKQMLDNDKADRLAFISGYEGKIRGKLISHYKQRIRYQNEIDKVAFLLYNQDYMSPNDISAAKNNLVFSSPNGLKNLNLIKDKTFKNYLLAYAQYCAFPSSKRQDEAAGDKLFKAVHKQMDRAWRHYVQAELLVNAFDFLGNPDFGLDRYAAMRRDGISEDYRKRVENAYGDVLNLTDGALAPNIGMYDQYGKPLSLSDLSGKVAYISFWASWCKPCLKNFAKYDNIRAELQKKGVVLLNISIDDNESAWLRALKEKNPRGENLRATNIDDVKRSYNLSSIPAYYIIDKSGRIAILPEGENRDLLRSFDEILQR